ncbi:HEAT repeat domain-containing protein [Herbidospora sp. NBRC 101105]|uniref:HEAT repeat domain-containing protein n=1 Tax=Herbidospora sp. NBRC 101105 TaxID=3032195 RepID=UPI00255602B3|nr:HEAT repeat domain-containing protein [Herbidospora sp. NBRC 101105]
MTMPFEELISRALVSDTDDERWEIVAALHRRGDAGIFEAAARLCAGDLSGERELGADVLAQLGHRGDAKPFLDRSLPILREMARRECDPKVLRSVLFALGHLGDGRALPEVLNSAGHSHNGVRYAAAWSLPNVMRTDDAEAVAALVRISRETDDDENRECATTGLAGLDADDTAIREALSVRLDDAVVVVAAEAAYGLARRGDRRAERVVRRYLAAPDGNDYTCSLMEWTAEELGDAELLTQVRASRVSVCAEPPAC